MKPLIFIFSLLIISFSAKAQQLDDFDALLENAMIWNPAMTSYENKMQVGLNYKQKWAGFENAPRTMSLDYSYLIPDRNMAIGGFILTDSYFPLMQNTLGFNYNYRIKTNFLKDDLLSMGIMGMISELQVVDNIFANQRNDEYIPEKETSGITPNIGVGLYYKSYNKGDFKKNYFYFGIGTNQLLNTKIEISEEENPIGLKRVFHGESILGGMFFKSGFSYEPMIWVNYAVANITNMHIGVKIEKEDRFWGGFSISTDQEAAFQLGYILKGGFLNNDSEIHLGSQANYNIGNLGEAQGMTYLFFARYVIVNKNKR